MCLACLPLAGRAPRVSALRGPLAALFALLLLFLLPRYGLAAEAWRDLEGTEVYGPVVSEWEGEGYTEVCYCASNRFRAAAFACGYTPSQADRWGSDIMLKLGRSSTGGAFYVLAQKFYEPSADDWVPTDAGPTPGFFAWAYTVYGAGHLWMCEFTDDELSSAKRDIDTIVGGGDVTEDSPVSGYVRFLEGEYSDGSATFYMIQGGNGLTVPLSGVQIGRNERFVGVLRFNVGSDSTMQDVTVDYYSVPYTTKLYYKSGNLQQFYWYNVSGTTVGHGMNRLVRRRDNRNDPWGDWNLTDSHSYTRYTPSVGMSSLWSSIIDSPAAIYGCDSESGQYLPDDDPETPVSPDPNPPSGDGPEAPTLPKPTNPTQPTNVTVTVTTPADDILEALNTIIQELENHCVHLQNKMVECSKYLGEVLIQVRDSIIDAFDANADFNARLHDDLMDYLEELFGWMRDNLNFDLTVTNTNNSDDIVDWLKRIYVQDGTGYTNSRPIDITQNYDGYGDWVGNIVGYMLPDLRDTNLAPVTTAFDALDDKFPFSVPNDVLRIFQSFDSQAVTPVIRLTIPSVLGISSYTYVFDLSPYDSAMQTIRTMELIAFVTFLLVWARRAFTTEAVGVDD